MPRGGPHARAGQTDGGFSLLEVLIALAVLAILGTVTLRGIHESQNTLAEDRWKDTATRLARNLLYEQRLEERDLASGGTFSPEHPSMHWRREKQDLGELDGWRSAVVVRQEQGSQLYEIRLETFDAHWTDSRKGKTVQ